MWFVLERLEPMPLASLQEAGEVLERQLRRLAPACTIVTTFITRPRT